MHTFMWHSFHEREGFKSGIGHFFILIRYRETCELVSPRLQVVSKHFFQIKPMTFLFPLFVLITFYNTTRFEISSHVLWLWYIKERCHFAFWLHMFLYAILKDQTLLQQNVTLKSPLPLVQCKVFRLSLYSVPKQPWWMNLSWQWPCILYLTQLTISNQFNPLAD